MTEINVDFFSEEGRNAYNSFMDIVGTSGNFGREPLYKCKAHIVWGYGTLILYSYSTPIAAVDIQSKVCYECLRPIYGYTATSCQHIAKFKKYIKEKSLALYDELTFYSVR